MKDTFSWAATASLTVCAALILAMHDATYRPAFVQIALTAMVIAKERSTEEQLEGNDSDCLPSEQPDSVGADGKNRLASPKENERDSDFQR